MTHRRGHRKPPRFAETLLARILPDDGWNTPLGDFEEDYNEVVFEQGIFRAWLWYYGQIIKLLPGFIRNSVIWSATMFKNYLKIAWRNIRRQKVYSLINIAGLAAGMTCTMLILMWVQHELSYDRNNANADDIYRVVENQFYDGGQLFPVAVTPGALGPALKAQFPEISKSTRMTFRGYVVRHGDHTFAETVAMADPDLMDIFSYSFIEGEAGSALSEPHGIVISERIAEKYFGADPALGQILRLNDTDFRVSAVIANLPDNAHLRYNMIIPFTYLAELGRNLDNWSRNSYYTYVLLEKGASRHEVDEKIKNLIKQNRESSVTEIYLQPLTDIHLHSAGKYTADIGGHGDIQYVRIFSAIALFVLLIACINFMNLSTARSERRGKEVGLRKVVGAQRHQLIKQFFGESLFLSLLAFVVAGLATYLLLPVFNEVSGKNLIFGGLGFMMMFGFAMIAFVTGILSGSYPALFLSSFKPIEILKGSKKRDTSSSVLRKGLVVIQFSLSVLMIIGTLVVARQVDYIQNKNLGLNKDNLVYVNLSRALYDKHEAAKHELLAHPQITDVSLMSQLPTYIGNSTSGWDWDGKDSEAAVLMHTLSVDPDYLATHEMTLTDGRFFSTEFATDSVAAVVNETAVKLMGMAEPIGKRLTSGDTDLTIVGVVKDFHFKPIQTEIEPLVMMMRPGRYNLMVMRTRPENLTATVDFIEATYEKFSPGTPFDVHFLEQRYDEMYRAELRIGKISTYFSLLAILIASLGLYGLASYMAEKRTREIGIRKVLGATIPSIFVLMSRNFILLVVLANLIAWPTGYFLARNWLQNYAYHASLSPLIFVLAAVLAVVVVLVTVSYQAVRAAMTNPAESLKYE